MIKCLYCYICVHNAIFISSIMDILLARFAYHIEPQTACN